jgi:hypothetical protein
MSFWGATKAFFNGAKESVKHHVGGWQNVKTWLKDRMLPATFGGAIGVGMSAIGIYFAQKGSHKKELFLNLSTAKDKLLSVIKTKLGIDTNSVVVGAAGGAALGFGYGLYDTYQNFDNMTCGKAAINIAKKTATGTVLGIVGGAGGWEAAAGLQRAIGTDNNENGNGGFFVGGTAGFTVFGAGMAVADAGGLMLKAASDGFTATRHGGGPAYAVIPPAEESWRSRCQRLPGEYFLQDRREASHQAQVVADASRQSEVAVAV